MQNKYGLNIEYDVKVPNSKAVRLKRSIYQDLINDFVQSEHKVVKIDCKDKKAVASKAVTIKKYVKQFDFLTMMIRGTSVFVVKNDLEVEGE